MRLKVTRTDGSILDVGKIGIPEGVAFERTFGRPISVVSDEPRLEWTTYLAYAAARRRGLLGDDETFDAFLELCDDLAVEPEDDDDAGKASEQGA